MEKADKRCAIIRAALELVAEHGFHGAPMSMVSEKAGVAAGTIYCYFDNKETLIRETYGYLEGRIVETVTKRYPGDRPVRERFLHVGEALIRYYIGSPLEFRFLEQFHNSPFGVEHRRDKFMGKRGGCDIFRELFEEGVSQQVMKDLPLVILFALSFGPILTVVRDHVLGFVILDNTLISRTLEACWDGIRR